MKEIQDERQKEAEQTVYLDGIKRLTTQIHDQNRSNMNLYNENMTTLVQSLKDSLPKTGVKTDGISITAGGTNKAAKLLTKPAKVPTWTQDLTLETFSKQLQTWSDILEEIPEYV